MSHVRGEREIFLISTIPRPALAPPSLQFKWYGGSLLGASSQVVKLTTHACPMLKLRMHAAMPLLLLYTFTADKLNFTSPPPFFLNWESKWNSRIFHSLYIQRNITVIYRIELNMNWIHGENTACLRVVDTGDGRYIRGKSYWTQTDMNIISSGPLGWGLDTQLCVNAKTNSDINTVTLHYNWTSCRWSEIPKMVWCHPHVTVITGLPSPRTAR